jgi:FtsP/CotA-like multicopper oxidase with cupredoxin domain
MSEVAPNERIKRGVTEDWEFSNLGAMMAVPHPIHIHGGQFQIVARTVASGSEAAPSTVSHGLVDRGWKDTFLLMPGERSASASDSRATKACSSTTATTSSTRTWA